MDFAKSWRAGLAGWLVALPLCIFCLFNHDLWRPAEAREAAIARETLEISKHVTKPDFLKKYAYLKKFNFTKSSDAHFLHIIGEVHCVLHMYDRTFDEFRKTLHGEDGRFIDTEPNEKLQLLYG